MLGSPPFSRTTRWPAQRVLDEQRVDRASGRCVSQKPRLPTSIQRALRRELAQRRVGQRVEQHDVGARPGGARRAA